MSGFLLDTNCISALLGPKPDRGVVRWMEAADESMLYLSVLTIGEIRKGIAALAQSKRKTQLETWLESDLKTRFAGRLVPIDVAVAHRWGVISAEAKRKGRALGVIDGLIAASALEHGLTVVSRNPQDFAGTPVEVLNPWET